MSGFQKGKKESIQGLDILQKKKLEEDRSFSFPSQEMDITYKLTCCVWLVSDF